MGTLRNWIKVLAVGAGLLLAVKAIEAVSPLSDTNTKIPRSGLPGASQGKTSSNNFRMRSSLAEIQSSTLTSSGYNAFSGAQNLLSWPGNITSLEAMTGTSSNEIRLSWIAPGADGTVGTASGYIVKYRLSGPIATEADFEEAFTSYISTRLPKGAGSFESHVITGLSAGPTYYFCVVAIDSFTVRSFLANNASSWAFGPPDLIPPANISDLTSLTGDIDGRIFLQWTAPGDNLMTDGITSGRYRIHLSTVNFGFFSSTNAVNEFGEGDVEVSFTTQTAPGVQVGFDVDGLNPGTTFYAAVITRDGSLNWSFFQRDSQVNELSSAPAQDLPLNAPSPVEFAEVTPSSITIVWTNPEAPVPANDQVLSRLYTSTASFDSTVNDWVHLSSEVVHPLMAAATEQMVPNTTYYFGVTAVDSGTYLTGFHSFPYESPLSSIISTATLAAVPASVSAFEVNLSSITVSWEPNGNPTLPPTLYEAQISATEDFAEYTSSLTYAASVTTASLSFNTTYFFRVKAVNRNNLPTGFSEIFPVPTLASSVTLNSPNWDPADIGVDISTARWNANGNMEGTLYRVQFATSTSFEGAVTSSYTYNLYASTKGLAGNTTVAFRVQALNHSGIPGDFTASVASATLAANPLTGAPTSFFSVAFDSAAVRWNTNSNDEGTEYRLALSTADDFTGTSDKNSSWGTFPLSTHTFTGMIPDTTYYARIRARNFQRLETDNTFLGSTTTLDNAAPGALTYLTALTGASEGVIELRWTAPGDSGYTGDLTDGSLFHIATTTVLGDAQNPAYWNSKRDAAEIQISTSNVPQGSTRTLTVQGLESGTTYYFRIWSRDEAGNWSNLSVGATNWAQWDKVAPSAVTDLTSVLGDTTTVAINLLWSMPGDDDEFGNITGGSVTVKYRTEAQGGEILDEAAFNSANYSRTFPLSAAQGIQAAVSVTGLRSETTYYFAIKVMDERKNLSAISNSTYSISPDTVAPSNITSLTSLRGVEPGSIRLRWMAPGDNGTTGRAFAYEIRRALPPFNWTANFNSAVLVTNSLEASDPKIFEEYIVENLIPGTSYAFCIKTYDESGNASGLSNPTTTFAALTNNATTFFLTVDPVSNPRSARALKNQPDTGPNTGTILRPSTNNQYYILRPVINYLGAGVAALPTATTTYGWLYDASLAGLTVESGSWTLRGRYQFSSTQLTTQIYLRINRVTVTETSTTYKSYLTQGTNGWVQWGNATFNSTTLTTTNTVVSINQTYFEPGDMLMIEFAARPTAGANSSRSFTWEIGTSSSFIKTTNIQDSVPPNPITTLTPSITGVNEGEIKLDWIAPGDDATIGQADYYDMRYTVDPEFNWVNNFEGATVWNSSRAPAGPQGTEETELITGLTGGVTYYFRIKAYDDAKPNNVSLSLPATQWAQADYRAPAAISDLTALPGSNDGEVLLLWTAPGDDCTMHNLVEGSSYTIRASTKDFTYFSSTSSSFGDADFTVTFATSNVAPLSPQGRLLSGLYPGATWYFAVIAADERGNWSLWRKTGPFNVLSSTPSPDYAPPAPENVSALAADVSTDSIRISWSTPALSGYNDMDGYNLYVATYAFESSTYPAVILSSAVAHPLAGATSGQMIPNTSYYFRVSALDLGNLGSGLYSPISESALSVLYSTATLAEAPVSLVFEAGDVQPSSVTFRWDTRANSNGTLYEMQTSTDEGFGVYTSSSVFAAVASSMSLGGNTTYYFRVRALNRRGLPTDYSNTISTMTTPRSPGITSFQVFAASVSVTLGSNGNAAGTAVSISSGNFETETSSSGISENSGLTVLVLENLTPNTTYTILARAVSFLNMPSSVTVAASTATRVNVPENISFLTAPAQVNFSSITVSWGTNGNPLTPPTSYQVQVSTVADFLSGILTSSETFNVYAATEGLVSGVRHYFRVRAFGRGGDTSSFNTSDSTVTKSGIPAFDEFADYQVSHSSIVVTWQPNGNSQGTLYRLQVSTDFGFGVYTASDTYAMTSTTQPLLMNTTYHFRIAASPFEQFSAVFATATLSSTVTLLTPHWASADVGITSAAARWNFNFNPPDTLFNVEFATSTSFVGTIFSSWTYAYYAWNTGLAGNTTVAFRIQSVNKNGRKSSYVAGIATATRVNQPTLPAVNWAKSDIGITSAVARWLSNGNSGDTRYYVEFANILTFAQPITSTNTYDLFAATESLTGNTTVAFRVRAVNSQGVPSIWRTVTVATSTLAQPQTFNDLTSADVSTGTIALFWTGEPNRPRTHYRIQVSSISSYQLLSTSFTFRLQGSTTSLKANTTYYLRGDALNNRSIPTAFTHEIATATLARDPVEAALTFPYAGPTDINLQWLANDNPGWTAYRVYVSTSSGFDAPTITTSTVYDVSASTSGLQMQTTYYFRVSAVNSYGRETAYIALGGTCTTVVTDYTQPNNISDLTALAGTDDGNAQLLWTSPGDDHGTGSLNNAQYRVRYSTTPFSHFSSTYSDMSGGVKTIGLGDVVFSTTGVLPGTEVGMILNGLNPGTTYYFAVISKDDNGNWASFERRENVNRLSSSTAQDMAPSAPTVPGFGLIYPSSITLNWTNPNPPANVDDRDQYQLYTATANFTTGNEDWVKISSTVHHPLNAATSDYMLPNVMHYFAVRSLDAGDRGNGLYSIPHQSALTAILTTATLANTPGDSSFLNVGNSSVTITWDVNGNPLTPSTSYQIQSSTAANFTPFLSSATFAIAGYRTGMFPNTTYFFRIRAYNRRGLPTDYNTVLATCTLPRTPGIAMYQSSNSSITVHVSTNANPLGTKVIVTTGNFQVDNSSIGYCDGKVTTMTLTGLTPNTTYSIRVRAENYQGLPSTVSAVILATATFASVPGTPDFESVPAEVNMTSITVTWSPNGNPLTPRTSYQVDVSTWNGFTDFYTSSITFNVHAATEGLNAGNRYYFRVSAFNRRGGWSAYSAVNSTFTKTRVPVPELFTPPQVSLSSISFSWQTNGNLDGTTYRTYVSNDPGFNVYSTSDTATLSITTDTLNLNTTYFFKVAASPFENFSTALATVTLAGTATLMAPNWLTADVGLAVSTARWNANGNPAGTLYRVEFATSADFGGAVTSSETYTLHASTEGLAGNTTAVFRVETLNHRKLASPFITSEATATFAFRPLEGAPTSFFSVYYDSVSVQWNANRNTAETEYLIQLSTSSEFTGTEDRFAGWGSFPLSTHTFRGLTVETTYFARIKSRNFQNIEAGFTFLGSTVTYDNVPPGTITHLTALRENAEGVIGLQWIAPGKNENIGNLNAGSRFHIATTTVLSNAQDPAYWDSRRDGAEIQIATAGVQPGTTRFHTVAGLTGGTTYYFRSWTRDDSGNWSALSAGATNWAPWDLVPPNAVTDFTAVKGDTTAVAINLSWSMPGDNGPEGDIVGGSVTVKYRTEAQGGAISDNAAFSAANYSVTFPTSIAQGAQVLFPITGLLHKTTYYFAVKVMDDRENLSEISNSTYCVSPDTIAPSGITNLTSLRLAGAEAGDITLRWMAPGDDKTVGRAANYEIRRALPPFNWTADFNSAVLVTNGLEASDPKTFEEFTISNLVPGTTYAFCIKTYDAAGNGSVLSNPTTAWAALTNNTTTFYLRNLAVTNPLSAKGLTTGPGSGSNTSTRVRPTTNNNYYILRPIQTVTGTGDAALPSATTTYGWLYDASLAGLTVEGGSWTLRGRYEVTNTGLTSTLYFRINRVTVTSADTTLQSHLTQGTNGWVQWGGGPLAAAAANTLYTTNTVVSINQTRFEAGDRLMIEFAYRPTAGSNGTLEFHWEVNESSSFIKTTNIQDGTAPNQITTLTALNADEDGVPFDYGEVHLAWLAPGNDGTVGEAYTYDIRYTDDKDFNWSTNFESASIWKGARPVSGAYGTPETEIVSNTGLTGGVTYYFRIKAYDSAKPANSSLSLPTTIQVPGQEVGILILGPADYDFGSLEMAVSSVAATGFVIRNVGNVKQDYYLQGATITQNSPWSLDNTADMDKLILWGGFSPTRPDTSDFGSEDTILFSDQISDAGKYAIGTSSGTGAAKREERQLWLKVGMPLITSTSEQQKIRVTISGSVTP